MSSGLRPLRTTALLALIAAALVGLAGCGGGGNSNEAKALIDKAFRHPIRSANLTIAAQANLSGVSSLQQPINLKVTGPYQSNGNGKLPSLQWQLSFQGGGQAVSAGLISTGDDAFVNFQGQNYEVGKDLVAQINRQLASQ